MPSLRPTARPISSPPTSFRDKVLAHLLELNRQHAEMERLAGLVGCRDLASKKGKSQRGEKSRAKRQSDQSQFPGF
jgi:hypothetical protein